MKIAPWAQQNARAILFVLALMVVAGAASVLRLPVLLFPQVSFPRVRVSLDAGDRPAERMMIEVTRPVEEAVRAIPGVTGVRSTSSRGSADVDVDFDWGHDMVAAESQVNNAIGRIIGSFPPGTVFDVHRMDPTVFPVIAYSLTSDSRSLVDLRNLAFYQLRPALSAVAGVGKVGVQGGQIEEWRVVVDQGKLNSLNMTLDDVAKSLSAANVLVAVGRMQQNDKLYLVISDTRFKTLDQIRQTLLRSSPDGVVRLDDVANVRPDTEPQFTRVTADGHDAVLFSIYQQPGGNTVKIAGDIKAKLQQVQNTLPELKDGSVKVSNWYDQSGLILASESSVRDAIAIGIGLAAIVLLLFLRNWKITLIATLAVPAVLATTLLLLDVMGMSLNIMTMGGMAAAVGLIIDDGIVMVEHIMRRVSVAAPAADNPLPQNQSDNPSPAKTDPRTRIVNATTEFTRPLIGSSSSTIIIFAPLAFLSGVTGAFFKALSITMAGGLLISLLFAWFAVPILAAHWLGEKDAVEKKPGAITRRLNGGYEWLLNRLLRHPWVILLIVLPMLAIGWLSFGRVKSGFMPGMDEGGFILDYNAPPGTSLEETDRELRQVEKILAANPAVQTYSRRTGLQLGGSITEANQGDFFVRLKPFPRPAIDTVMSDVRQKVAATVPALRIETSQLMEDLIGDLTGVPQPIDIKLFSPDENALLATAPKVEKAIGAVNGVIAIKGIVRAGDALNIEVDRVKAAIEGMDPDAITKVLDHYLSGQVTTQVQQGPRLLGVRVWVPGDIRTTESNVRNLRIRAPDGHLFPLKRVATLAVVAGQPQITRENLERMAGITAQIEGRDLGSVMADVKKTLAQPGLLPDGMTYELGGTYERQQKSFQGLLMVMIAALLLVFILLLFLYGRFLVALAMMLIIFLAISSVFLGLYLTGTELDIMSIMGMTMIVGIVTETAIFYYTEFAAEPSDNAVERGLIAAGIGRIRAIAMTTIAAILALMTLALGIGQGSALLQPLAIAIIAGLIAQLPLVLIVLPVVLKLFRSAK